MSQTTSIEWTDATWNPTRGCSRVSEGCRHCYAERVAARFSGPGQPYEGLATRDPGRWTGRVELVPEKLDEPLHWRKPRRVFVNSMSDLFHEALRDEAIDQVFAVMACAEQHTFQVLTKRPERMSRYLTEKVPHWSDSTPQDREWHVNEAAIRLMDGRLGFIRWPLPNAWLGVSVENQETADERIPLLLQTPASVRFLSVEPLLGPVDLSKWIRPRVPTQPEAAPEDWSDFPWPEWVPEKTRREIADFWLPAWGRNPAAWLRSAIEQGSPPFGMSFTYRPGEPNYEASGRWVHCWNNIGRLVGDDGVPRFASFGTGGLFDFNPGFYQPLHWIIVGGESGPSARPMHPDWARSLRDQCQAAGVPFFFKQWGEYGFKADLRPEVADEFGLPPLERPAWMQRMGKKAAGRLLDGREWSQFPKVSSPAPPAPKEALK